VIENSVAMRRAMDQIEGPAHDAAVGGLGRETSQNGGARRLEAT
jgi:hypothetical protein